MLLQKYFVILHLLVDSTHKCNCQFGEHFLVEGPLVSVTDPSVILW